MALSIAVLGANGVYGRHLIPRLVGQGHRVRALVRRPEAATIATACGAEIHVADIFDFPSLTAAIRGCDIGINLATTLPGPSGRGDYAENDRLRREGVPIWLQACENAGVGRVIQQSVGWVNSGGGDAWSDEDSYFTHDPATPAGAAIVAAQSMEESVRQSQLDWLILRGGLFYGPGTGFDDGWFQRAFAGHLRLPGDGTDYISLIHIADMAAATMATIEDWPSCQALIVSDDQPAQWRDVFRYIARAAGASEPQPGGVLGFPSSRLLNGRARATLNWAPFYADYRSGFAR